MTARICVSILPKNNLEALTLIERAEKAKANLVEVRLDYLEASANLSELVKRTNIPLIATNKLSSEKGFYSGTENERQQMLLTAAKTGFEYVDVNLSSPKFKETIDKLEPFAAKTIISYHKFDGSLSASEMEKVLEQEIASGASVCKIVTTAKKIEDNLAVLNFVSAQSSKANLVCFCMGEQGKISRLLSPMFSAFFTFASLDEGRETGSGQMTIQDMRAVYDRLGA